MISMKQGNLSKLFTTAVENGMNFIDVSPTTGTTRPKPY